MEKRYKMYTVTMQLAELQPGFGVKQMILKD